MIAAILLILAIVAYSCSQLLIHGKFRWMSKDPYGFWGEESYVRKYKLPPGMVQNEKDRYKERFPLSTTFLVFLTDGYHLMQFIFFLSLSLSFTFAISFSWVKFGLVWGGIHVCHFLAYKLLSR